MDANRLIMALFFADVYVNVFPPCASKSAWQQALNYQINEGGKLPDEYN